MKLPKLFNKQNRVLLRELVRTDFKLRYQGSVLGYAWSLLKPLLLFVILYIVFVFFLKIGEGVPHFPVYLLLGIVLWNFFTEMTNQSLGSIVARGDLIRKIRISRWIIVFSSSISALINLAINLVVVFIFALFNGVSFGLGALLIPLSIVEIYVFALGLSLFLAAFFVRFRDVQYIWEVVLQAGFYATPILYPLSLVTIEAVQKLLLLNPIAQAIQDARFNLVTDQTLTAGTINGDNFLIYVPIIITIGTFIFGMLYFRKHSKRFAEDI